MGYTATPIVVKKYIKLPARKLISGFLTVNCVSHPDNDSYDDANQVYYDTWAGGNTPNAAKLTRPWNNVRSDDPSRNSMKHAFGDYDCLLFWVAGGMILPSPVFSNKLSTTQLSSNSFISGTSGGDWNDGTGTPNASYDANESWYDTISHNCQHFLKSHLISRINNGYGWADDDYEKINGIVTNRFEMTDNSGGSLDDDISVTPTDGVGKGKHVKYISSDGIFSNNSDGDFKIDLSTVGNNTYFPMIENVEIYGKHQFTIPVHTNSAGNNTVYSNGNTTVGNYSHTSTYWDMVIAVHYRSYSTNYASGDNAGTHEFFKSNTNISFRPFGETSSFQIDDNPHTS
tara:strand:+ start:8064 stop:9092 length:1029 start_codon:yes stop_codon:yes gene_type:complete